MYGAGVVEPRLHVVRQYAWRNAPHRELYPVILSLVRERWRCRRVVVDATGVGGGLAAFLGAALGPRVVTPFLYTAASKSRLAFDFLGAVNAGRVRVHGESWGAGVGLLESHGECGSWGDAGTRRRGLLETSRDAEALRRELFGQAGAARYELRAGQVMRWGVPETEGHDDLLNALVLCVQAGPLVARRVASGRRAAPGWAESRDDYVPRL